MAQLVLFGKAKRRVDFEIDVSNMAHRAHHRFKDLSANGHPTGHIFGAFSMLLAMLRHHGPSTDYRVVLCTEGSCKWRRELLPSYKANRGHTGRGMVDEVAELLALVPSLSAVLPDQEADDAIAAHIRHTPDRDHLVFSQDRDLWQLIGPRVEVTLSSTEKSVDQYQILEDFKTSRPELVPLAKALMGDTSDNISGVMRFPRDDAEILLAKVRYNQDPEIQHANLLACAESCPATLKPRTLGLVRDSKDQIVRTIKVATLQDSVKPRTTVNAGDRETLQRRLEDLACVSIVRRLDELFGSQS